MMNIRVAGCVSLILLISSAASAQNPARGRAQTEAILKVSRETAAFARTIGLNDDWWQYCWTDFDRKVHVGFNDGSVPFGINWNTASDETFKASLDLVANYQKHSVMFCLSEVKRSLAASGAR